MNIRKFKSDKDALITEGNRIVDEYGFGALRPKKQPGRPQCLTELQKENIKVTVASDSVSFSYTVWDGPSLSDYIAVCKVVLSGFYMNWDFLWYVHRYSPLKAVKRVHCAMS